MSWWVSLKENGKTVTVDRFEEGGVYVVGGETEAHLNVTYNYGGFFGDHLDEKDGLRWLDGKTGKECEELLASAVAALGTEQDADYWAKTPGNAGHALSILLRWARQYPNATFTVH